VFEHCFVQRSLLSIDSVDLLLSSQCICFAFMLSCFRLVLMCFAHVGLLSRCIPRYFTSFSWGRSTLPIGYVLLDRFGGVG
jgi:hypothetical protein